MFARLRRFLAEEDWAFAPHEVPVIAGSPGSPEHPLPRQLAYAAISILLGLTAGLGNALVAANTTTLQGALGLDPAQEVDERVHRGIHLSINGVAAGLRNTG